MKVPRGGIAPFGGSAKRTDKASRRFGYRSDTLIPLSFFLGISLLFLSFCDFPCFWGLFCFLFQGFQGHYPSLKARKIAKGKQQGNPQKARKRGIRVVSRHRAVPMGPLSAEPGFTRLIVDQPAMALVGAPRDSNRGTEPLLEVLRGNRHFLS